MAEYIQVFVTAGSREEARTIAAAIVEQRLAACVQVVGPIQSTYWWQGRMETAEEYLCVMKSRQAVFKSLEVAVREVHSYETPEILAMPVVAGNEDYLSWMRSEMRG